jgi:predicted  nucleic acid-binding Zn-ribbon protein
MSIIEYLAHHFKKAIPDVANAPQGGDPEAIRAAQKALEEVQVALAEVQKELAVLKAAQAELKAQEDAYAAKIKELEAKSQTGGVVSRNKAANELAQMKAEDPLPLRKAKITNDAAVRRVEKAEAELLLKMEEATEQLRKIKQSGGASNGQLWWMERELFEADKYLPSSKQQFNHREPFKYTPS